MSKQTKLNLNELEVKSFKIIKNDNAVRGGLSYGHCGGDNTRAGKCKLR